MHTTLEESLAHTCPNCGKEHHAKFFSLFVSQMHYIIGDCDQCGYRIEFRKDDLGAGLFLPDGNVVTITETFKQSHTEHMKGLLNGSATPVEPSLSSMRMRFVEQRKKS